MKNLAKIDRFVYVFAGVLVFLALLLVVVFRGLFSAILVAYGSPIETPRQDIRINRDDLSKALEFVRQSEPVRLNFN